MNENQNPPREISEPAKKKIEQLSNSIREIQKQIADIESEGITEDELNDIIEGMI